MRERESNLKVSNSIEKDAEPNPHPNLAITYSSLAIHRDQKLLIIASSFHFGKQKLHGLN